MFILLLSVLAPNLSFRSTQHLSLFRRRMASLPPLYVSTRKGSSLSKQKLVEDRASIIYQPEPISSTDTVLYGLLASIQLLPPLALIDLPEPLDAIRRPVSYLYFIVSATILVILGAKRQDIKQGPQQKPISLKSAALAPVVSSVLIFTIYLLLKYTDIEIYFDRVYQFLGDYEASNNHNYPCVNLHPHYSFFIFYKGTTLGILSVDSVFSTAGQSIFPKWLPTNKIFSGTPPDEDGLSLDSSSELQPVMNSDEGLIVGLVFGLSYLLISYFGGGILNPESLFALSFFNNFLASAIAMQAIGTVKVEGFAIACALLSGLFFYDIYWVFFSEVMMTVATKVDAPIKFLFPASLESMPTRSYPFSVLGLGDIVVPGVMAALARKIDLEGLPGDKPFIVPTVSEMAAETTNAGRAAIVWPNFYTTRDYITEIFRKKNEVVIPPIQIPVQEIRKQQGKVSYLDFVTVGYVLGLGGAFTANEITRSGQPALLYLVPTVILSMLFGAYKNNELKSLWGDGFSFKNSDTNEETAN